MSIKVGLRPMGRRIALPGVPWDMGPMEYVFTEGTSSPYNIKYDDLEGSGPYTVAVTEQWRATFYPSQRKLIRMSDKTLYAAYLRKSAGKYQIYVKKSIDNGVTWTDETRISTLAGMANYDQYTPSIAVDSSNNIHVVWIGRSTSHPTKYQIWYALYDGSWQTPVRISTYPNMADDIQDYTCIAVDSGDNLHVVWHGLATGYPTYNQIWYALYDGSWQTPVRISTYEGMINYDQHAPSIAVDSSDNLYVLWFGKATGYTDHDKVWYAVYDGLWADPDVLQPIGNNTYPNLRWSRWP